MFNLETSIANWRQQMLAAGITPTSLDELELHLREEIERQSNTGLSKFDAFHAAAQKVGAPRELVTEFSRAGGWSARLEAHRYRILGALWLAFCVEGCLKIIAPLSGVLYAVNFRLTPDFFLALLLLWLYVRGSVAGIQLLGNQLRGRRFIRLLAFLDAAIGLVSLMTTYHTSLTLPFTLFGAISFWLLRPTAETKTAGK